MVVRRNDARRRRLVIDPAAQTGAADGSGNSIAQVKRQPAPSSPPKRTKTQNADARAYSYAADRRNQLKTTDLIPKRVLSYLLVVLVLLACLAAINFCANQSTRWHAQIGDSGLIAFAINGQGSVARWFLSFLLIMTGLSCLQIYAIRQHRCNDYRGTYRLWMWLAALFVIASVNCVVDLGAVASSVVHALTKQTFADRLWLPVTAKLVVLSIIAARLLYEVRESRGSLVLVVVVWVAYTSAAVMQLPAATTALAVVGSEVVIGNCVLFGTATLLLAHLTYGRFIFLQANGLAKQKRAKKATKQTKTVVAIKQKSAQTKTAPKPATSKKKSGNRPKPVAESVRATAPKTKKHLPPKSTVTGNSRVDNNPTNAKKSPSDVLKELAAASRAKGNSNAQSMASAGDDSSSNVIKMTKAQRRKQRKLEKQSRRAA